MTVHPSLQTYADAWTHSIEAISELVEPLAEGEWNRRDAVPQAGRCGTSSPTSSAWNRTARRPAADPHAAPRPVPRQGRVHPLHGDAGRHAPPPHRAGDDRRAGVHDHPPLARSCANETRAAETGPLAARPLGARADAGPPALRMRAFDVWVHEQDLRRALRTPGQPGLARRAGHPRLPGARCCRRSSPRTRARRRAPPSSSTCTARWSSCGRSGSTRTAAAGRRRALAGPGRARSTMDWETYVRLACGRVRPAAVADRSRPRATQQLAAPILAGVRGHAVAPSATPQRLTPGQRCTPLAGTCTASTAGAAVRARSRRIWASPRPSGSASAHEGQHGRRRASSRTAAGGQQSSSTPTANRSSSRR